jgi:hypothetical protein
VEDDDDTGIVIGDDANVEDLRSAVAVLQARMRMVAYELRHNYVTRHQFEPVRLATYGILSVIVSSVLVAVLSYVLHKGGTP